MGRPGYLQRWGYDAAPGACVQPPDGMAGDGFPTGYRPPAQWFNWCFGNWSDWINHLRGANHEAWTRTAWGTSPSTFDAGSALFLAVDTETVDAVGAAYRYVIAGQEAGSPNTAALRVSQRGNAWLQRTNVTATTTALPTALAYVANPVSSGRWLLGCNDASINYCTCDAGGGTGPVGSGSGNWSVASTPGGMTNVVAFAAKDSTAIFALTNDGGAVSTNHGLVWSDYAGTSGTGRSGNGSDAVWTGTAFVFITTDGQIYKSAVVGGTFAYQTDLGGTATWKLATDGDSGVLAYRVGSGSLLDIFWSSDDGGTWETITPTSGFNRIQRIRHHEGTWLACSTVAPFLWASNDHENWRKLRMPVGSDAALYDLAWDGGAWVVAGNGFVLQCPRGHDPGDADGSWSPAAGAAPLVDAGYLRGIEVSATAPTSGQALVYNTGGYWEPGSAGSVSPTTTRGDLIRRGASADERFAAKAINTFVGGDGTDVGVRTVAQVLVSLSGRVVDPLSGSGWSQTTVGGAAAAAWSSGPARLSLTNPGAATGDEAYSANSTFLPDSDAWDLYARFDVLTGTSADTWFSMRGGVDGSNGVHFDIRGNGAMNFYQTVSGTPNGIGSISAGTYNAPSTSDLASGNFWARISRRPNGVALSWAVSSSVPTSWKTVLVNSDALTLNVSNGTYVRFNTYAASAAGNFDVDVTDIRATGAGLGPL